MSTRSRNRAPPPARASTSAAVSKPAGGPTRVRSNMKTTGKNPPGPPHSRRKIDVVRSSLALTNVVKNTVFLEQHKEMMKKQKEQKQLQQKLKANGTSVTVNIPASIGLAFGGESSEEDKENQRSATLQEYTNMVRDKCVLTERWIVFDPQLDPSVDKNASLVVEMDKTAEGELRAKRCVKIFDDRSYQVLVDNVDMTAQFAESVISSRKLETTFDSDKLMHAVINKKVCQGLRSYDPTNPIIFQAHVQVKQRGNLWYSKDCTVVVQKSFMGNSCGCCMKVKNQIRRCLQPDPKKKTRKHSRAAMKQVRSTFGKAVYSLLNDFSGRGPIPLSQYPRENMVFDDKLGININLDLHQRLYIAATMPPPPMPLKSRKKNRRGSTRGRAPVTTTYTQEAYPVQQFITEDGQICYVTNVVDPSQMTGDLQYSMPMIVEKFEPAEMQEYVTVNEDGMIIQNFQGGFHLAEGQEYELIGEAPTTSQMIEPIELYPADNQTIQIIEVDEHTLEQIELQGAPDTVQIAAVDPNDPSLSHLFRAFQSQIQGLAL